MFHNGIPAINARCLRRGELRPESVNGRRISRLRETPYTEGIRAAGIARVTSAIASIRCAGRASGSVSRTIGSEGIV